MNDSERRREKQGQATAQARALLHEGHELYTPVKHVYRVRPGGERTLHTVVASWAEDMATEFSMTWGQYHRDWYRRPSLGDVLLGEVVL